MIRTRAWVRALFLSAGAAACLIGCAVATGVMSVLETVPAAIAKKFPDAIVDLLKKWSVDPHKRIATILAGNALLSATAR